MSEFIQQNMFACACAAIGLNLLGIMLLGHLFTWLRQRCAR